MIVSQVFSPDPRTWASEARVAHASLRAALTDESLGPLLDASGLGTAPFDLNRFTDYCRRQGVIPTVYEALCSAELSGTRHAELAETAKTALRPAARAASGAALFQAQQLTQILASLADAGVPVIVLKGLCLDVHAYHGPGRRKDGDHDLLIPHAKIRKATDVLRELGFSMDGNMEESPQESGEHHAPPFLRRREGEPPVMVELHWDLTPSTPTLPLPGARAWTKAVWQRAEAGELLGQPVRRLTVEDEAVLLALHTARHLTYYDAQVAPRLSMIEDLVRVLQAAPGVDAGTVAEISASLGPVPLFGPVRYLSRETLGIDIVLGDDQTWPTRHLDRSLVCPARVLQAPGLNRSPYRRRWDQVAAHAALMPRMAEWRRVWRRAFHRIPAHATTGQEAVESMESWITRGARLSWRILTRSGL